MQKTFEKISLGRKSMAAFAYELEIRNLDRHSVLSSVTLMVGSRILTKIKVTIPVKPGNIRDLETKAMEVLCRHLAGNTVQTDEPATSNYPKKGYKATRAKRVETPEEAQNLFSSFNL